MWKNNGIDAVVAVTSLIWVIAVVCLVVGVLQRDLLALWCHDNALLLCSVFCERVGWAVPPRMGVGQCLLLAQCGHWWGSHAERDSGVHGARAL